MNPEAKLLNLFIYLSIYLFTHLFKVDNDKKDTVYKNINKIAWGRLTSTILVYKKKFKNSRQLNT